MKYKILSDKETFQGAAYLMQPAWFLNTTSQNEHVSIRISDTRITLQICKPEEGTHLLLTTSPSANGEGIPKLGIDQEDLGNSDCTPKILVFPK